MPKSIIICVTEILLNVSCQIKMAQLGTDIRDNMSDLGMT